MTAPETFDPLAPEHQQDPYASYPALRADSALWVPTLGNWWVGRYRDVKDITSRTDEFSNAKFHEIALGEFDYSPGAANLVASDPPVHSRLRAAVSPGFRTSRIRAMEDRIREIVGAKIEELLARPERRFDFATEFAELVPIAVVIDLLGADPARIKDFQRWSLRIMSAANRAAMNEAQLSEIRRAVDEARAYFLDLIAHRRAHPGDDLISLLVGSDLTDGELLSFSILLLNGGQETTAHLMGNAMVALWRNREQFELVRTDPRRVPDAIDETLRFDPPVQTVFLWTTRDVRVGDVDIPKDSAVIGCWGSANRDPQIFDDPDRFDINRRKVQHLAFGNGPHFCIGNMLARLEASIALQQIFERMPGIWLETDGPVDWIPSYWIRGPRSLPVAY